MKKFLTFISAASLLCGAAGCSHKSASTTAAGTDDGSATVTQAAAIGWRNSKPVTAMPKASAFRMSGDYADKVAITVGADGKLLYFPDPHDITAESAPINLGDGWWLNRQGISANSVFTTYTFSQYAALSRVPSAAALKAAIIPGAKVTEMQELPFTPAEAVAHLDSVRSLLRIP